MISYRCISRRLGRPGLPSLTGFALIYCCLSIGVLYKHLNAKPSDQAKLTTLLEHGSQNASRALIEAKEFGEEFLQDIIATRKGTFIALNWAASFMIAAAVLTTRIFLGQLSVIETSQLIDRMLRFMLLKVVFLGAVVSPEPPDVVGYLLWASFTAFLKAFVGLAKDRGEALLSSPTATIWQHMRCASLLGIMLAEDAAWIVAGIRLAGPTAPFSWAFLWFFDAACVGIEGIHAVIRYFICGFDLWRAQRCHSDEDTCHASLAASESDSESRSQFLYFLDLGSDLLVHVLNLVHYGHILHLRGGLRMQLIDVALLTDVRFLVAAVFRRGQRHLQYRKLNYKLRYCFPNAPVEELTKEGGVTCAICMENMKKSAKILPCGHMYHLGCLREWLQQGTLLCFTCPICRAHLMVDEDETDEDQEEENIDQEHSVRSHRRNLVRRVPDIPPAIETARRRSFRGQQDFYHQRIYRVPLTNAQFRLTVSTTTTTRQPTPPTRPTVAVYYPSVDDPYFYNEEDSHRAGAGGAVAPAHQHRNYNSNSRQNNSGTTRNNQINNEIDSWGQDVEVDWDGSFCRFRQEENVDYRNGRSRRSHGRRQRQRNQQQRRNNTSNSNDRNNAVGWETDTSGPSSSTVAFQHGFRQRRNDWHVDEEEEDGEEGGIDTCAWSPSPSVEKGSFNRSARRPVTRSMSRGL